MPRYRLTLEYDGAQFQGFQAQASGPTVQSALEAAVAAFCGETIRAHAAGRTDAGVHASGQVIHIDLSRAWLPEVVVNAVNAHLAPLPIAVLDAAVAPEGFDARFSAHRRRYLYRILNRRAPAAIDKGRVWHIPRRLDDTAMATAAAALIGRHDFTTFRDARCQARSPVRTLDEARVWREGEEVRLAFAARSFLHRQVRSMVGALAQVGLGRWSVEDLAAALAARRRSACAPVAPAAGLCLTAVDYEQGLAK
ncbi:MAG TPA: tRNA pseudouridine(38-40) synthase TruA [Caulobacteraceae bacterium]